MSVPPCFLCPITSEVMVDPVSDPDGNTYERRAITEWLTRNPTSPITRAPLRTDQLVPNRALREAIGASGATAGPAPATVRPDSPAPRLEAITDGSATALLARPDGPETRQHIDLVCVVDISGSMQTRVTIDGESDDLSLLDMVKHAVKTVAAMLGPNDRLALVSFSSEARVELPLTAMTLAGQHELTRVTDGLRPEMTTNLWAGLKAGMDLVGDGSRPTSVVVLTDGVPSVEPPRGILDTFGRHARGCAVHTVHTMGFGYQLQSALLRDLAEVGHGVFCFIPDAGFVGTTFINLVASLLLTTGPIELDGDGNRLTLRHGLVSSALASGSDVEVTWPGPGGRAVVHAGDDDGRLGQVIRRTHLADGLRDAVETAVRSGHAAGADVVRDRRAGLVDMGAADAELADLDGQVREAFSRQDWFERWGVHYVRSLALAHRRQQCTNFKDPGLQCYADPTFDELREIGEQAFASLPPPQPARRRCASDNRQAQPINMARYISAAAGCLAGDGAVAVPGGKTVRVADLTKGSVVLDGQGRETRVRCLVCVEGPVSAVRLPGGPTLTPWHPVLWEGRWRFPQDIGGRPRMLPRVYNVVLDSSALVVDSVPCAALGHGLTGPVIAHDFFGTDAVVKALTKLPGYQQGRVSVAGFCRDAEIGRVVGLF